MSVESKRINRRDFVALGIPTLVAGGLATAWAINRATHPAAFLLPVPAAPTKSKENQPSFRYVFRPLYLNGKGGLTYERTEQNNQPFCAEIVPESSLPNPTLLCSTPAKTVEEWLKNPTFPGQMVPIAQGTTVESYSVYESKSGGWTLNPGEAKDIKNPACKLVRWPASPEGNTPPAKAPICK